MLIPGSTQVRIFGGIIITIIAAVCGNLMPDCICGVMHSVTPPYCACEYTGMGIARAELKPTMIDCKIRIGLHDLLSVVTMMGWLPPIGRVAMYVGKVEALNSKSFKTHEKKEEQKARRGHLRNRRGRLFCESDVPADRTGLTEETMKLILGTMTFGESVFAPDVETFVRTFLEAGYTELDTAYVYNDGSCERLLGEVLPGLDKPFALATKVNPRISGRLDGAAAYKQVNESLERLKLPCADIVYLHFPDPATPVEDVLAAMADLHDQGKFKELGLSNFPAWMVADAWHICDRHGWVKPTVFEGMYNPLTRRAERELNACLDHFGMRYYAYNPLCGGLLTGRYGRFEDAPTDGRFTHRPGYQNRYWKKRYFDAVEIIREACDREGITMVEAVYRWMACHSMLREDRGDGIIIGASRLNHLRQNLETMKAGPLPEGIVEAFEQAWTVAAPDSPEYFTLYKAAKR